MSEKHDTLKSIKLDPETLVVLDGWRTVSEFPKISRCAAANFAIQQFVINATRKKFGIPKPVKAKNQKP